MYRIFNAILTVFIYIQGLAIIAIPFAIVFLIIHAIVT